jgi:3-hydroxyacyl-[acyl-carrier-protein] dehydratase
MAEQADTAKTIDIHRIMALIPHRYPFLLVDKIVSYELNESAVGLKNVTMNEPHFMGHFPGAPVMPGVLIVESMAQTAGILVMESMNLEGTGRLVYFMTIDEARFRKPVVPGDTMYIHVTKERSRGMVWKFKGEARVNDTLVAEATFSAMIVDRERAEA